MLYKYLFSILAALSAGFIQAAPEYPTYTYQQYSNPDILKTILRDIQKPVTESKESFARKKRALESAKVLNPHQPQDEIEAALLEKQYVGKLSIAELQLKKVYDYISLNCTENKESIQIFIQFCRQNNYSVYSYKFLAEKAIAQHLILDEHKKDKSLVFIEELLDQQQAASVDKQKFTTTKIWMNIELIEPTILAYYKALIHGIEKKDAYDVTIQKIKRIKEIQELLKKYS